MTPLNQQLEDKKKGCGYIFNYSRKCGNNYYCEECQAEIAILEQAIAEIDVLCSKLFEKDLLLQKQRQEILDEIGYKIFSEDEQKSNNVWYKKGWDDSAKRINKVIQEVKELNCLPINYIEINEKIDKLVEEQLNQPKTEQ